MGYNYDKLFDAIMDAARGEGPVQQRMLALIAACEAQRPHRDWEAFKRIDYDQDREAVGGWIARAAAEAGAGSAYRGLWFGLTNPVYDGAPTADIYVAASPEYTAGEIDWAAESTFYPDTGNLHSRVLYQLYQLAYANKKGLGNDAEYPLVLGYGAIIARRALEGQVCDGAFTALAGAAVGYDGGDFLFLGQFGDGKFKADIQAG